MTRRHHLAFYAISLSCLLFLTACPKPQYPNCKTDDQCNTTIGGIERSGVCVFGKCQECTKDTDCKGGKVCRENMCETLCDSDADCGKGMHCSSAGVCRASSMPCEQSSDCEEGYTCENNFCAPAFSCSGENTVFFDFDKYNVKEEGADVLRNLAMCMKNEPGMSYLIEGHTDKWGTAAYNMVLGEERAQSVEKFLKGAGVDTTKLDTVSYGFERPLSTDDNPQGWAKNRRAVVVPK